MPGFLGLVQMENQQSRHKVSGQLHVQQSTSVPELPEEPEDPGFQLPKPSVQ